MGSNGPGPAGEGSSKRTDPSRSPWHSIPGPLSWVGPRQGRRATWVGASADQTYLKVDESLINSVSLNQSTIMANKTSIRKYIKWKLNLSSKKKVTAIIDKCGITKTLRYGRPMHKNCGLAISCTHFTPICVQQ